MPRGGNKMTTQTRDFDDHVLISRVISGDTYGFDELAKKHRSTLYAAAYKITKNHEHAADAVADALLRVHRCAGDFRFECKVSSWLYRIAENCAKDVVRRATSRQPVSLDQVSESWSEDNISAVVLTDVGPDEQAFNVYTCRKIQRAIDRLPEQNRELLIAVLFKQATYEQLAEAYGLPIGTVKSRIHRAREQVKDRLPTLAQIGDEYVIYEMSQIAA